MSSTKNKQQSFIQDKRVWMSIITVIILCFSLLVIMGKFTHGYFSDDELSEELLKGDNIGEVSLEFEQTFSFIPSEKYYAGIEIYFTQLPENKQGTVSIKVTDGKVTDTMISDITDIVPGSWHKFYGNKKLKPGHQYNATVVSSGCSEAPYIATGEMNKYTPEYVSGDILAGFAYKKSVFNGSEKILISLALILLLVAGWAKVMRLKQLWIKNVAVLGMLTLLLTWNYMFNSFDVNNTQFDIFQKDSESLVTGLIAADINGVSNSTGYGLGRFSSVYGNYMDFYGEFFKNDEEFADGYHKSGAMIAVPFGKYNQKYAIKGNSVLFSNGDCLVITEAKAVDKYINIYFDTDNLSAEKQGDLGSIIFLDENGRELPTQILKEYDSQYGLQGKIFRFMAAHLGGLAAVEKLQLLCCLATAFIFVLIVFLIRKKYDGLMAGCFFVTFAVSPWIVNFARNLYWVEFTWFMPMVIGLICSIWIKDRRIRILSYLGAFISVTIKSMCGYEYITTVMLGLIAFLLTDLIVAWIKKDHVNAKIIFRTTLIIGMCALAGFFVAILLHAGIRGEGNLVAGIKSIIENDVIRRTYGADLNAYADANYKESYALVASMWEVICKYFHFNTQIITGVNGNLFPALCIVPLIIFGYDYKAGRMDIRKFVLYVVMFVTSMSWFVLAKSHSYVHDHINFVMWYFGFVQICFYVILSKLKK